MFELSRNAWGQVEAHAVETYPDECCGVVLHGPDGHEVRRVRNVQDEMHAKDPARYPRTARTAYTGHAGELHAALERAEAPGCRLLAFYHSHPDHAAYFSEEDVVQATPFGEPSYPEAFQVVVSVFDGRVREAKAFSWSATKSTYVEVPVRIY